MDVDRFLERIGIDRRPAPDLESLATLQAKFLLSVPFENLDIHYGNREITLDLAAIFDKIVVRGRGGFCYESNGLFAWLLKELGFEVVLLSAQMMPPFLARALDDKHMFLQVTVDGIAYAVDVGNGQSFRSPLAKNGTNEDRIPEGFSFRIDQFPHEGVVWRALQYRSDDFSPWETRFVYESTARSLDYFTTACHWQQTSPESNFVKGPLVTLALPDGRVTVGLKGVTETHLGVVTQTPLADETAFLTYIRDRFGLTPDGPRVYPPRMASEGA